MSHDPLAEIIDKKISADESVLYALLAFRAKPKLKLLPGDNAAEQARLSGLLNALTDKLISGVQRNPTKLWVLTQFQPYLALVEDEDTEGREHFGMEVEEIMEILGIDSSDGLLTYYLGGL